MSYPTHTRAKNCVYENCDAVGNMTRTSALDRRVTLVSRRNFAKKLLFMFVKRPPPSVKKIMQTLFIKIAVIPSVSKHPSIIPNALPTNATSDKSSHQLQKVPKVST